jgi:hypothetical protein
MKRFAIVAGLLIFGAGGTWAQDVSVRYQSQAISSRGLPLTNQNVAVCGPYTSSVPNTNTQPCSPLATLATSSSTTSGGTNPTTTDALGNFFFYAAPGKYLVQIYGPQISGQFVQPDVTLACQPTGSCTVTGATTVTGALTATGANVLTCKNFENVRCVDSTNSAGWSGTDVGGWLNSACADLPAYGGKVMVAPTPTGSIYTTSTQLTCSTVLGKPVLIEGLGNGAVAINFTATSGIFYTDDPGIGGNGLSRLSSGSSNYYGHGLRNLIIIGPGCASSCPQVSTNTTVLVQLGATNGTEGALLESVDLEQAHVLLQASSAQILTPQIRNSIIVNADTMINFPSTALGNENITFGPVLKVGSTNTPMPPNCVKMDSGSLVTWLSTSFDSCQFEQSNGLNLFYGETHFENPASTHCSANPWYVMSRGRMVMFGGDILNDCNPGTMGTDLFEVGASTGNAEFMKLYGVTISNSNYANLTQLITNAGGAEVVADIQTNTSTSTPWSNGVAFCNACTGPIITYPATTGASGSSSYTPMRFSTGASVSNNQCWGGFDTTGVTNDCLIKMDNSNTVSLFSQVNANYLFATPGGFVGPNTGTNTNLGQNTAPWATTYLTGVVSKGTLNVAGTGACATITTTAGGATGGTGKCTGTTGASTLTITPGITAPNGWTCDVWDETTRANIFQQTSHTTTTCVLTSTSITQNDVFVFKAIGW